MAIKRLPRRPCTEGLDSYDQCFSYALSAIFDQVNNQEAPVIARNGNVLYVCTKKMLRRYLGPIKDIDPTQKRYVLAFADAVFSAKEGNVVLFPLAPPQLRLDGLAAFLEILQYPALARQHRLDLKAGYVM